MAPNPRRWLRRTAWAAVGCAGLTGAFVLGVVAGAGSAPAPGVAGTSVLDQAAGEIAQDGLHPVDRAALDAAAIKAMLSAADDEWGSWGDGAGSRGTYAGVGLSLRREGSSLLVGQVALTGPAGRAGVRVGDALQSVDDVPAGSLSVASAAAALRGVAGSAVTLRVSHGAVVRTLHLTREVVTAPGVSVRMAAGGVGQITVPVFAQGTGRKVRDAVAALHRRKATGIVLDLRGDPGGLLSEAVETAGAFLEGGPIVTYARRDALAQRLEAQGRGDTRTPLVVLVDGATASAAEIVTGALQDRGRAVVVGARTFGKGTVQEPHRLDDGSSLALTVARYTLPSGRSVEGVGIEPDIRVADGEGALRRAIEVLSGLLADTGGRG